MQKCAKGDPLICRGRDAHWTACNWRRLLTFMFSSFPQPSYYPPSCRVQASVDSNYCTAVFNKFLTLYLWVTCVDISYGCHSDKLQLTYGLWIECWKKNEKTVLCFVFSIVSRRPKGCMRVHGPAGGSSVWGGAAAKRDQWWRLCQSQSSCQSHGWGCFIKIIIR